MPIDTLLNLLVVVTLVEMMLALGLAGTLLLTQLLALAWGRWSSPGARLAARVTA
jgi:hypothetical protein